MEIKLQTSRTILNVNGEEFVRIHLDDGTIFWDNLTTNRLYKLESDNWTECESWNRNSLIPVSCVPTWEQEYQKALLAQQLQDNVPLELVTVDGKNIIIEYNSKTKQLVIKAGANTLKSRLVN